MYVYTCSAGNSLPAAVQRAVRDVKTYCAFCCDRPTAKAQQTAHQTANSLWDFPFWNSSKITHGIVELTCIIFVTL